ncbi:MAG: hypothetical protein ACI8TQ_002866 [Planctomycetota bacterium]
MNIVEVKVQDDGHVDLTIIAPWVVAVLLELGELLDPDQPECVQDRLYPAASDDAEHNEEWEKFVHPDLMALVASAREIVTEDLKSFIPADVGKVGWQLKIPPTHVRAWISALNAARLTIAELHQLGVVELEALPEELEGEIATSVAKVRLFGWIQELILEGLYPDVSS